MRMKLTTKYTNDANDPEPARCRFRMFRSFLKKRSFRWSGLSSRRVRMEKVNSQRRVEDNARHLFRSLLVSLLNLGVKQ